MHEYNSIQINKAQSGNARQLFKVRPFTEVPIHGTAFPRWNSELRHSKFCSAIAMMSRIS